MNPLTTLRHLAHTLACSIEEIAGIAADLLSSPAPLGTMSNKELDADLKHFRRVEAHNAAAGLPPLEIDYGPECTYDPLSGTADTWARQGSTRPSFLGD